MTQPPAPGRGQGEEPVRDSGLAAFSQGGAGDTCPPDARLAAVVAELSGPEWRCEGATDDELAGLLGRWAALESWAAAGKLGVVRELIRRRALPGVGGNRHGDLPDAWEEGLGHEVAVGLGLSVPGADRLIGVAWDLRARLPGIGDRLADGTLSYQKAKIISDELSVLDDQRAAAAEALIMPQLAGKTPGQLGRLAAQAACTVDPEAAQKWREHAEHEEARLRFWRDNKGAAAMAAYGLPTDEALAANAAINERAGEYKKSKAFPDARMDQLRVLAFLDILNAVSAATRIARARAEAGDGFDGRNVDGNGNGDGDGGDGADGGNGGNGSDGGGSSGNGHGSDGNGKPGGGPAPVLPALTARANLTIPLVTLLGLAERPGAGHGLGPLDPALARDLAAIAAESPHSQWCVTVTDPSGIAIGHGCAKPARTTAKANRAGPPPASRDGPWAATQWSFTSRDDPGPPGGYGAWTLSMPGGRELTVKLGPVPVTDCDHRHESDGYQPNDALRHLVQVRDGECTFPSCSRHARESDFEHAVPFHKGGRTCACNGGARSRKCHRAKQSRGWAVTQPRPGWHQWTTPGGRTYTQGPMRYPA